MVALGAILKTFAQLSITTQPSIRKVIDLDHFAAKANCPALRLKR